MAHDNSTMTSPVVSIVTTTMTYAGRRTNVGRKSDERRTKIRRTSDKSWTDVGRNNDDISNDVDSDVNDDVGET
ncbi:unnamed protein product [Sphagnum troendelagicum]|uniref:Uncharacterized protein n=1 Tax=Sphagnum troendelagicum TaxID=128251 RepID=A0ABP0UWX3_9BRYO